MKRLKREEEERGKEKNGGRERERKEKDKIQTTFKMTKRQKKEEAVKGKKIHRALQRTLPNGYL